LKFLALFFEDLGKEVEVKVDGWMDG